MNEEININYDGICPECDGCELEQSNTDIEYQNIECLECGCEFEIISRGWKISSINKKGAK